MTTVERPHAPMLAPDGHGNWFTYCLACSHAAGDYVIECAQRKTDREWPPFLLADAPQQPRELTPEFIADLNAQFDPTTNEHTVREHMLGIIEQHILNRPRSLQREIGPSEIGHECGRYIAYKLADVDTINPASRVAAWRPQVGVFAHEGLDGILTAYNAQLLIDRFLTERKIKVYSMPSLDGGEDEDVSGTADVYDAMTASVIDFKFVGPTTMKKVRARVQTCYICDSKSCEHIGQTRGASPQYRKQGQTYGVGYSLLGLRVRWVIIAYFPTAGELDDAYFHVEPFNPAAPAAALERLTATRQLLRAMPLDDVLALTPTADHYCQRCPFFNGFNPADLTEGCPGHEGRKVRESSLMKLIPPPLADTLDELTFSNTDRPLSHLTRGK